jgi:pimeloyl-ACP methyl ester carboxylesterase
MMDRNPSKYDEVPQRVIGQVWDSAPDDTSVIKGVLMGTFPKNSFLRSISTGFLWSYLKLQRVSMKNLVAGIEAFKANRLTSPALFIGSEFDTIVTPEISLGYAQTWRRKGTDVTCKLFNESEHVSHYQVYPEEYLQTLEELWRKVKLL